MGAILLDEELLLLLERLDELDGHLERLRSHLGGCQGEPLRQGNIGDAVRFIDLDPDQVFRLGRVLDVVAGFLLAFYFFLSFITSGPCDSRDGERHNAPRVVGEGSRVTRAEVKGAGVAVANEDGGTSGALVEVQPLLSLRVLSVSQRGPARRGGWWMLSYVGVPVELAQAAGLESHKGGGNGLAGGEVGRVDLPELAAVAGHRLRGVLEGAVDEGAVAREVVLGARAGDVLGGHVGGVDVGVLLREFVKDLGVDTKVLGDDVAGGVVQPVDNVEGCSVTMLILVSPCFWGRRQMRRTRLSRNQPRQRREGTRCGRRDPGRCGRRPWGSTRCRRTRASR